MQIIDACFMFKSNYDVMISSYSPYSQIVQLIIMRNFLLRLLEIESCGVLNSLLEHTVYFALENNASVNDS